MTIALIAGFFLFTTVGFLLVARFSQSSDE